MTAPFYITKRLDYAAASAAGTVATGTISIESFIDLPSSQGLEILEVEWIVQGHDTTNDVVYYPNTPDTFGADGALGFQLSDQVLTALIAADNRNLIASGGFVWDHTNNVFSGEQLDFFPDIYNKNTDGRVTINDQLYIASRLTNSALNANQELYVTCRMKVRVVNLTKSDFVSISLTNVSADN